MTWKQEYFIEVGPTANEVIARRIPQENTREEVLCQDGSKRNFWLTDHKFVLVFVNELEQLGIPQGTVAIFYRKTEFGPIIRWHSPEENKAAKIQANPLREAIRRGLVKRGFKAIAKKRKPRVVV